MPEQADLIVIGSGAAGLSAAVTAAYHGLSVTLLEKAPVLGGTTAWSGGWIWAPRNPVARSAGIDEPAEAPRRYLQSVLGNRFEPARVDAFLQAAPRMVAFFEANTALQFGGGLAIPDTYGHLPGAGTGGRSVIAQPYDGRGLGKDIALLRRPVRETTFYGMTIQAGADLRAFMTMTRSPRAFAYAGLRTLRHLRDLALHRRGMDLRNGNALVARLIRSALDQGVTLRPNTDIALLTVSQGRVNGVRLADGGTLTARRGVVLACGGYPHDQVRRVQLCPQRRAPHPGRARGNRRWAADGPGRRRGASRGYRPAGGAVPGVASALARRARGLVSPYHRPRQAGGDWRA